MPSGGDAGLPGWREAQAGACCTFGSTLMPWRAAAATIASLEEKSVGMPPMSWKRGASDGAMKMKLETGCSSLQ